MKIGRMFSKKNYLKLILLVFYASCANDGRQKTEYKETIDSYPSFLTSHFPKKENLKKDFTSQIFYPSQYSPLQYYIKQTESDATIDSLISGSTKIIYSDSSYYVVNKHLRTENLLSKPQNYDSFETQKFVKGSIPIPNFYRSSDFEEKNYHYLKDPYSIYLVETIAGKCCDEELHQGKWHMPEQWENGFSKGYAINKEEKEVIYWYVIW